MKDGRAGVLSVPWTWSRFLLVVSFSACSFARRAERTKDAISSWAMSGACSTDVRSMRRTTWSMRVSSGWATASAVQVHVPAVGPETRRLMCWMREMGGARISSRCEAVSVLVSLASESLERLRGMHWERALISLLVKSIQQRAHTLPQNSNLTVVGFLGLRAAATWTRQ
jgi:hypothetical protein